MGKREQLLMTIVAGAVLLVVAFLVFQGVAGQFKRRWAEIARLEKDVSEKEKEFNRGARAKKTVDAFRARSLPADYRRACSLYQKWLLDLVHDVGMDKEKIDVSVTPERMQGDVYRPLLGKVIVQGDLKQLTEFLYRFYRLDHVHKIRSLQVDPVEGSRTLKLNFTVEALSMARAEDRRELASEPADRLAWKSLSDYTGAILDRNIFDRPNRPPKMEYLGSRELRIDDRLVVQIGASDPDPLDRLEFSLGDGAPPGASIDGSGRLEFRPTSTGRFEIPIRVTDDGLLPKSDTATLAVTVVQPTLVAGPTLPSFEDARFTRVCGITEVSGRPEVWLRFLKTETTLILHEGEPFELGTLRGVVHRIDTARDEAELTAAERRLIVKDGAKLSEARLLPQ